ncbi:MAG: (d)CMP kinase [Desulfuromonadales bacterium]|nr:(d)CMP kinase [Desulfuromonadales bacterium]
MMSKGLIIAIDGPSGAGKSTLSRALARELGYMNIDTGAMYRSVALLAQRQQVDPADADGLQTLCQGIRISFVGTPEGERVLLNGEDVSKAIRTPQVSLLTAQVAASQVVRGEMLHLQREMGKAGGVVLEGRDIGTVVFPDAQVKFFLSATAQERGRRRYDELREKGTEVDLQRTIAEVEARDAADEQRAHAPLRRAADAVDIDSTAMSIDQVLQKMLAVVAERRKALE